MKIVLCGPPNSGKSCLRQGLKEAVLRLPDAPYPYVITACPDGEGSWFHETMSHHSDLAINLKKEQKQPFTWEFANKVAQDVTNCVESLVLIDIGGIRDDKNQHICANATHAIVLSGDHSRFQEWQDFCEKLGLTVLAKVYSDYQGRQDQVNEAVEGLLTGSVHYLERGEPLSERPMIQALAKHLLAQLNLPSSI